MWKSLIALKGLLTRRQRWQGLLLLTLLLINALVEMIGVGFVPLYIGIVAQPERVFEHDLTSRFLAFLGVEPQHVTASMLVYAGSAVLLALITLKLVYTPFVAYVRARYIQSIVRDLSTRLFQGYIQAPYVYHLSRNTSELMRNVNQECIQLGVVVLHPIGQLVTNLLVTLAIVVLLLVSTPGAALFAGFLAIVFAVPLVAKANGRIKFFAVRAQQARKDAILSVQEGLGGVKELRLSGREGFFLRRFQRALARVLDMQRLQQVLNATLPVMMEWVSVAALLAVVIILFRLHGSGTEVLATAALFAVAMARMKGSISVVLQAYTTVRAGMVSVDVVEADVRYLEELTAVKPADSVNELPSWHQGFGRIQIAHVWYRYPGAERYALRDINLSIQKGEAIGFVGRSGSGKSTLIDVLLGILTPSKGVVFVDEIDIQAQLKQWYRLIGYVPQSVYLVDGTIRQNIALGLQENEIDETAVRRAVDAANLLEVIENLPNGLDTLVGERGVRFSGGQRQRIAIARALYNDPEILVMDEATAALDNLTESIVMSAVDALKGSRTVVMIAHRLSTVQSCDRIAYMEAGEIHAIASYHELTMNSSSFRRLAQGA